MRYCTIAAPEEALMPLVRLLAVLGMISLVGPFATSPLTNSASRPNSGSHAPAAQAARLSPAALQVAAVRDRWVQYLNAKQIAPLMMLYAPDAVFLQPTGARINGAPSIRAMTQKIWASLSPNITMHGVTTKVSCDMAYDEGDFHEVLTSNSGAKQQTQGQYLMIFKRDNHGRWLIVEQMWTGPEPSRD
jgi:ketosteroid isomerase-like protein